MQSRTTCNHARHATMHGMQPCTARNHGQCLRTALASLRALTDISAETLPSYATMHGMQSRMTCNHARHAIMHGMRPCTARNHGQCLRTALASLRALIDISAETLPSYATMHDMQSRTTCNHARHAIMHGMQPCTACNHGQCLRTALASLRALTDTSAEAFPSYAIMHDAWLLFSPTKQFTKNYNGGDQQPSMLG